MNKLASIIIPYYNQGKYLEETLHSALAQTYDNFEVIVVNDGSNQEASLQVWEDLQLRLPAVKFISQENKGLSSARNTGICASQGTYICCLDSDDLLDPHYLTATIANFQDEKTAVVATNAMFFGTTTGTWQVSKTDLVTMLVENQLVSGAVFTRAVFDELKGYDEKFKQGFEDWDFWLRILEAGYQICTTKEALYYYRKTGHSMFDETRKNRREILKKLYTKHQSTITGHQTEVLLAFQDQASVLNQRLDKIFRSLPGKTYLKLKKIIHRI